MGRRPVRSRCPYPDMRHWQRRGTRAWGTMASICQPRVVIPVLMAAPITAGKGSGARLGPARRGAWPAASPSLRAVRVRSVPSHGSSVKRSHLPVLRLVPLERLDGDERDGAERGKELVEHFAGESVSVPGWDEQVLGRSHRFQDHRFARRERQRAGNDGLGPLDRGQTNAPLSARLHFCGAREKVERHQHPLTIRFTLESPHCADKFGR